jgi:thiamine-phosphate pyrophosphorylase
MIDRLHYISQEGKKGESHINMIQSACENGVKWVQLRIKNKSRNEILDLTKESLRICQFYKAKLILNDYVDIAAELNIDGVHLGKDDMSVKKARNILGTNKIIGGTANDLQTMFNLTEQGVNYIGLGPFRFTNSKSNLSPVLGIGGYVSILSEYAKNPRTVPVIAIGGIDSIDISSLMSAGVYGVAIASKINFSQHKKETIQSFLNSLNP